MVLFKVRLHPPLLLLKQSVRQMPLPKLWLMLLSVSLLKMLQPLVPQRLKMAPRPLAKRSKLQSRRFRTLSKLFAVA
ncbi:hypothetical protein PSEUDO8BK_60224 [Pseudomonas sp. 8BK]|nr:hypothetical protein PSEUDO8BK_60224 [Pseudomonas sp. 8BK]